METIRHSKNGYILGFDRLNVDPQSTRRRVLEALESEGLAKTVRDTQAATKEAVSFTRGPQGATVHYAADYDQLVAKHSEAVAQYKAEYVYLMGALVIYFQPRAGEVVVDADKLAQLRGMFAGLEPGQKLTLEGEVVNVG